MPILQDQVTDAVGVLAFVANFLKHRGGRRVASLGAPLAGQPEFLEEHVGQLLRRVHVELVANDLVDFFFQGGDALVHRAGDVGQDVGVDSDAGHFHIGQNRHQGHFHVLEQVPQVGVIAKLIFQQTRQSNRHVRVGAGVRCNRFDGHLGHGDLVAALADEFRDGLHLDTQPGPRDVLQVEGATRRLQQPGRDHGVEHGSLQLDAVPRQDHHVVLDVVSNFRDARVFQQGANSVQGLFQGQVGARVSIGRTHVQVQTPLIVVGVVPHRDVPGLARLHGQGQPDQIGQHRVLAGGLGIDGECLNLGEAVHQVLELGRLVHSVVFGFLGRQTFRCFIEHCELGRPLCFGQSVHQAPKLQLAEQLNHPLAVEIAQPALLQVQFDREVALNDPQLLAQERRLAVFGQSVAGTRVADFVQVRHHVFDRPVFLQEGGGRLVPNPRHPRDVVRRIPFQALVVRQLLRLKTIPLLNAFQIVDNGVRETTTGGQHAHVGVDELERVCVAGDDQGIHAGFLSLPGESTQHIVRLVAFDLVNRHVQRFHQFTDAVHLDAQRVCHLRPVGLVLGVLLLAATVAGIETDGDVVGFLLFEYPEEHRCKAVRGVRRFALGGGHLSRQGMERPIGQGVTVDQNERFALLVVTHWHDPCWY